MADSKVPTRVAVIGAGYFAGFHHDAWQRLADSTLVAIVDRDVDKAAAAAARVPGAQAFDDVERMLDTIRPDLVDIATPPESHGDLVAMVAERGLPAICQKPLAPTLPEAEAIVELARQAGTSLVVHENFRFQPWYRELRRLIADGLPGRLHSVAFRMRPGDGQGPEAYLSRQPYFQKMPRFLVHETAIHFIDTFRYLMGEVTGVMARLRRMNPAIVGEDAAYIVFDFDSRSTGLFDGNRLNDHIAENARLTMGEMWLEGANGVLRLDGHGRLWWKPHGGLERPHRYGWQDRGFAGDCVLGLQRHVLAHLRDGAEVENSAQDYLRNIVVEEAVYRSAETGRWIDLSPTVEAV